MAGRRQKNVRSYDIWTFEEDSRMLDLLVEQVNIGNKLPNGVWKYDVLLECVNKFNEDVVNKKNVSQLKNRTRSWKKTYQIVTSCLNTNGFSWDANTQRVIASPSVWQDYLKEHRDANKYRREWCPLYDKLSLVVGNSIVMGTTGQTCVDLDVDHLREPEGPLMDELEDVNVVRDIPSPFLSRNEAAPVQSQRSNPSLSTRRRKRTEMSTDDIGRFIDAMKDIAESFKEVFKPKDANTKLPWYEALLEIPDLPIELKYRAPDWLETPNKKDMFIRMTKEERLDWLKFCYRKL
ncbi:uncharacterized protein At2g29880-like [Aristolochia californica]|uniref:uncharacterized protein At2g29880-like n=1 Tax=Aristolochia californica TaxID=171875 RepID=UPI0035DF308C